jgi:hypothetical protein
MKFTEEQKFRFIVLLVVSAICSLALSGCGTTQSRAHTVKRVDTTYRGMIGPIPVPTGRDAQGNLTTAKINIPITLDVAEDTDEEAEAETKTKLDPALQAALGGLQALLEKAGNAAVPGGGSLVSGLFSAFSSSGSPSSDLATGGGLIGAALTLGGSGYMALKKNGEAKRCREQQQLTDKALEDSVSFSQDALKADPSDAAGIDALKEKHRLRQIARGTNHVITQKL